MESDTTPECEEDLHTFIRGIDRPLLQEMSEFLCNAWPELAKKVG
jgi:hypothetical protein